MSRKEELLKAIESNEIHNLGDFSIEEIHELILEGKVSPKIGDNGDILIEKNDLQSEDDDWRVEKLNSLVDKETKVNDLIDEFVNDSGLTIIMDRSMIICEDVESRLLDHPLVLLNPKLHDLAIKAFRALFDFYQLAGAESAKFSTQTIFEVDVKDEES